MHFSVRDSVPRVGFKKSRVGFKNSSVTRLLRTLGRQSRSWDAELSASPFFEVPKQKGRGGLKPDEVVAFLFRILPGVFRILLVVSCKPPALPSKHASHFPPTEQGVQRT